MCLPKFVDIYCFEFTLIWMLNVLIRIVDRAKNGVQIINLFMKRFLGMQTVPPNVFGSNTLKYYIMRQDRELYFFFPNS